MLSALQVHLHFTDAVCIVCIPIGTTTYSISPDIIDFSTENEEEVALQRSRRVCDMSRSPLCMIIVQWLGFANLSAEWLKTFKWAVACTYKVARITKFAHPLSVVKVAASWTCLTVCTVNCNLEK